MSLPSYLPVLRGWKSHYPTKEQVLLEPGKSLALINESKPGWFGFGMLTMDSPYGILHVQIDEAKLETSPYVCQVLGLVTYPNSHIFCSMYDPLHGIFNLAYVPSVNMPFERLMCYVIAPVKDPFGAPITASLRVMMLGCGYWIVENSAEFKASVREIQAPV
jgi:hypothetical protein